MDCVPLTPTSSFYMCAARRGPTSLPRTGRPRSGRESRPVWSVGPKRWRSTLTQVSDSEEDSDFVDSDYELEDDDALFNDNVEDNVVGKGKMIVKGRLKVPTDDVSSDGDGLQLPDSHDEGDTRLGFKCFRQEDMCNPIFKVGMC